MILPILVDHPRFLLINKPAGLSFHREGEVPGVLELLRAQTGNEDLHAVHRLDAMTSGLLLIAKGVAAARDFGALFASRQMRKYYLALAERSPKKKQGSIVGDMQKGRNGSWRLLPTRHEPAYTQFFSAGLGNGLRLFLVRPLTGRTHQIRVALKSLGSPILGDLRYAGAAADRGYLHAYALAFELDGRQHAYRCLPDEGVHWQTPACQAGLARFADPAQLAWPAP